MLESMEGRRGMPRLRPPFPAQVGYLGRPTLINNVETLAHVPAILGTAGGWARSDRGAQARLWSVSGAVARPGCYEAPLDVIDPRELIESTRAASTADIGAIVPGGAASGILPPAALDVPLTRDGLGEWGAGVGSAGVQVFPAVVLAVLRLLARDDALLRRGVLPEVHALPDRQPGAAPPRPSELEAGEAVMSREQVEEWLEAMERTSICGLGQGAPIPVRNAFAHWPELFAALGEADTDEPTGATFTLDGRDGRARPRASCSSTRPRATASSSRRSATTTSSTPTAAAACASSTSRARRGRCRPARRASREGMVVSTNGRCRSSARRSPRCCCRAPEREPGRPAERADRPRGGARRRGAAHPPRREARALRGPQPADGLRPRRVHPLQPLRALHAGGDAVLGALARGPRRPRRASSRRGAARGSTPSASSAAAASPSARRARSTRSSTRARRPATSAR